MPQLSMRQLLAAGVHFGHQTRYWHPKMSEYLFGQRNKIHIINLEVTLPLMEEAGRYATRLASNKGSILFVGTKRAARPAISAAAQRCDMPYVSHRWLGGMLTNFSTVRRSVERMKSLREMEQQGALQRVSKKEALGLKREFEKLERSLGGIETMMHMPDAIFVIDINHERIAIAEARKLGIPVIAVVDSNCDPWVVDYVIPGNDDAFRAIQLYADFIADAVLEGKTGSGLTVEMKDEFIEETGAVEEVSSPQETG